MGRPACVAALLALNARPSEKDSKGLTAVGAAMPKDKDPTKKGGDSRESFLKVGDEDTLRIITKWGDSTRCVQILGDGSSSEE